MSVRRVLLVTGASGYLGRHLTRQAEAAGIRVISGYRNNPGAIAAGEPLALDLLEPGDGLERCIEVAAPTAIIHAAALNPGADTRAMMAVNGAGARRIAQIAARLATRLVHLSSDIVHDGRNAPYADSTPGTATSAYGLSKIAGEDAVAEAAPGAARVRASLIYGLGEMDRSTAAFAARLAAGKRVALFHDVIRQPIQVETLSSALLALAFERPELSGSFNIAGEEATSREAFARKLLEFWRVPGREGAVAISALDLSDPPALDLRLDLAKVKTALGIHLEGVDAVVSAAEIRRTKR